MTSLTRVAAWVLTLSGLASVASAQTNASIILIKGWACAAGAPETSLLSDPASQSCNRSRSHP